MEDFKIIKHYLAFVKENTNDGNYEICDLFVNDKELIIDYRMSMKY
jgi:hypothetical protein